MNPVAVDGKIEAEGELYLTAEFWKRLGETFSESPIFDELEKALEEPEPLDWYDIREYRLDDARDDELVTDFPDDGDIVHVVSISEGASVSLKFDSRNADAFDLSLDGYKRIKHTYTDLYLTNDAQSGATIKLLFGRGNWDLIETVPEIDLSGTVRNDYLEQITDPLKIGQIIRNGHIIPHADIACEKILISANTRLDQWRSTDDYTYMAPGRILLHATTVLSDWQHPANMTYIHGGQIYTESIQTASLAALSITTEKLAALAVTADKIEALAITTEKLAASAVTAGKILAGAVETDKLAAGAVTAGKMTITDLADIKNLLTVANYIKIGATVLPGDKPGIVITDGTYNRIEFGQINGDFGGTFRDADGVVWCQLGKLQQVWQKIYDEYVTGSHVTQINISGLDGNNDQLYFIVWTVKKATTAVSTGFDLQFNGDTGGNYGRTYMGTDGGAFIPGKFTGHHHWTLTVIGPINHVGQAYMVIDAKTGKVRTGTINCIVGATGTDITRIFLFGQVWSNTGSNITSIRFFGDRANAIGIGSHLVLYKMPAYT